MYGMPLEPLPFLSTIPGLQVGPTKGFIIFILKFMSTTVVNPKKIGPTLDLCPLV